MYKIRVILDTKEEGGTECYNMEQNQIVKLGVRIFKKEKILEMKYFILLYRCRPEDSHYVFVNNLQNGNYFVYNYFINDTDGNEIFYHEQFDKEQFEYIFLVNEFMDDTYYPKAWKVLS